MQPTYYVKHPDGSYSPVDTQPVAPMEVKPVLFFKQKCSKTWIETDSIAWLENADDGVRNVFETRMLYAAPPSPAQGDALSQPWIDFNDTFPEEGQYVVICGPMPSDVGSAFKGWRTCARYVAGDLLDGNGCTRNSATHWMPMADSYADIAAIRALAAKPADAAPATIDKPRPPAFVNTDVPMV